MATGGKLRLCRTCKRPTIWRTAVALLNDWRWSGDFRGDPSGSGPTIPDSVHRGATVSQTGPARLVQVEKCSGCGRSIRA